MSELDLYRRLTKIVWPIFVAGGVWFGFAAGRWWGMPTWYVVFFTLGFVITTPFDIYRLVRDARRDA